MSCVWTDQVKCVEECVLYEGDDPLYAIYTDEMGWLFDNSHMSGPEDCYYVAYLPASTPVSSASSGTDGCVGVNVWLSGTVPINRSLEVWANFSAVGMGDPVSLQMSYLGMDIYNNYVFFNCIEAEYDVWLESLIFVGLCTEENEYYCQLDDLKIIGVSFGEFYRGSGKLVNTELSVPGTVIDPIYPPDGFFDCCVIE